MAKLIKGGRVAKRIAGSGRVYSRSRDGGSWQQEHRIKYPRPIPYLDAADRLENEAGLGPSGRVHVLGDITTQEGEHVEAVPLSHAYYWEAAIRDAARRLTQWGDRYPDARVSQIIILIGPKKSPKKRHGGNGGDVRKLKAKPIRRVIKKAIKKIRRKKNGDTKKRATRKGGTGDRARKRKSGADRKTRSGGSKRKSRGAASSGVRSKRSNKRSKR